jgi:hypothetical protein
MTPARPLAASVVALGLAGVITAPAPAVAALAPCEQIQEYAAQSGAELLRVHRLDLAALGAEEPAEGAAAAGRPAAGSSPGPAKARPGTPGAPGAPGAPAAGPGGGDAPGRGSAGRSEADGAGVRGPAGPRGGDGSGSGSQGASSGGAARSLPGIGGVGLPGLGVVDGPAGGPAGEAGSEGGRSPASGDGPASAAGGRASAAAGGGNGPGSTAGGNGSAPGRTGSRDGRPGAAPIGAGSPSADAGRTGARTVPGPGAASAAQPAEPAAPTVSEVAMAAVKSAFVSTASPNSAAVGRMLGVSDGSALGRAQIQQAPPTNAKPGTRATAAADVGPLSLGAGTLASHAQWQPGMVCGTTVGSVTRAEATLRESQIAPAEGGALVDVPDPGRSLSTTTLERHGGAARTVAAASVDAGRIDLFGGAVRVTIEKPPTLLTSMSTSDGGEVRYVPPVVKVSGDGVDTVRLSAAGDSVALTLGAGDAPRAESGLISRWRAGLGRLTGGAPLSLPTVPKVPSLRAPESATVAGAGTTLRISLGDVRQATDGYAIAARADAIRIALTQAGPRGREPGYDGVVLDLGVGVLESASVSPEPAGFGGGAVADASDDLPVTGPRVDVLALAGAGLLVAGTAALVFGLRRRRFRA